MQHTKHIWRAVLLIVAVLAAFSIARHFMLPASFGEEGFYRAESRAEFMTLPVIHGADRKSCAACHEKEQETHDGGAHAPVTCEVCHAPESRHVRDGEKIADMPTNQSRRLCQLCHLHLAARPDGFPQIVPEAHLVDQGAMEPGDAIPDRSCALCHPAHDPKQE